MLTRMDHAEHTPAEQVLGCGKMKKVKNEGIGVSSSQRMSSHPNRKHLAVHQSVLVDDTHNLIDMTSCLVESAMDLQSSVGWPCLEKSRKSHSLSFIALLLRLSVNSHVGGEWHIN